MSAPASEPSRSLLEDLERRGLLHQATHRDELERHLRKERTVYAGFDPTKDSLTIGNLVSILMLRRFQLAGHRPMVVMGGGTGLIGDPSGKDSERQLLDREGIARNIAGQKPIFGRILDFEGPFAAKLVNNADWIEPLSFISVLRDIGKHFSVNMMIQKDSVKTRLEGREHGISYTEFSYMILQAYDFAQLAKEYGVTVQIGGSDQWGNIVAGADLTRRLSGQEVFGLTTPLLTKSDGGKFGKTEGGAIWLTREHTSPYELYQFFMNAADADVGQFLRVLSLRPLEELEALIAAHQQSPERRLGQRALADEMTELLHGKEGQRDAQRASEALFSGDVSGLSGQLINEVFRGAPSSSHSLELLSESGLGIVELLVKSGVAKSKREARQHVSSGAISINGKRISDDYRLTQKELLEGDIALIRRGKKTWHIARFDES